MELSQVFENVKRNAEFEQLGIIDSDTNFKLLTFIDSEKYINRVLSKSNIKCVLTTDEICNELLKKTSDLGICVSQNPRIDFFKYHNLLSTDEKYKRKCTSTTIGNNCKISSLSFISSTNVSIGDNVIIEEFVSIKENTVIGSNCIIRAGTIIGGEGFEFKKIGSDQFAIKHLGGVIIGDNVEIQYNCTVDKALYPWDTTKIDDNTKLDNLIYVGHAVKIGKNVLIPAGTTISGRAHIGDNVWIGIGSVISNGISFGENSRCNIGSVVTRSVKESGNVTGNFAIEHEKFINNLKKVR